MPSPNVPVAGRFLNTMTFLRRTPDFETLRSRLPAKIWLWFRATLGFNAVDNGCLRIDPVTGRGG
jgi:hypothetical protein